MTLQQLADLRHDVIVAAHPVLEDAKFVLHLFRAIDRHGNAYAVLRQPFDHVGLQQGPVRGEAEVDLFAFNDTALPCVLQRLFQDLEVEEGLTPKECQMDDVVAAGFLEHEVDTAACGFFIHEPRFAADRVGNAVLAILVAIRACEIALAGHV